MLVKGIVVENVDPKNSGRIKVRIEQSPSTPTENAVWAEYCSPLGGGRRGDGAGFFMIPNIGDVVFLNFENDESSKPVFVGCAFSGTLNDQAIPIEARIKNEEPLNRTIKTKLGHIIELDDRFGGTMASAGIRLTTAARHHLIMGDSSGKVSLRHQSGHELKMIQNGFSIVSQYGQGIYLNDKKRNVLISNIGDKSYINLAEDIIALKTDNGIFNTCKIFGIDADSNISAKTQGKFDVKCGDAKLMSGDSFVITSGNKLKLTSVDLTNISFGSTGNFVVEGTGQPIPGVSGMIQLETVLGGQILGRISNVPNIAPLIGTDPTTGEINTGAMVSLVELPDLTAALAPTAAAARFGISGTTGDFIAESFGGAMAVTGLQMLGGGIASPLGLIGGTKQLGSVVGMAGAIANATTAASSTYLAPTFTTPVPGGHPAVLGDNLLAYLSELNSMLFDFFTQISTVFATNLCIAPSGAATVNPALLPLLAGMATWLGTAKATYLTGATPTSILSPYVIID